MKQERKLRRWQPTRRQVLWATGMVVALLTAALLLVNLYPSIWKDLLEKRVLTLIGIGVALTVVIVLLAIGGASLEWTGFGEQKLWDWLQLLSALAIPIVLAVAGFWFTAQQEERQQRIEAQRAESERSLEEQRADDAALQAYLDQMGTLLVEKNLRDSEEGSEVRTLARARTATVMQRLDSEGNRNVIRFLSEAGLTGAGESSLSLLTDARLSGTELSGVNLEGANLSEVHLYDADLSKANLHRANLQHATLGEADLSDAFLVETDLTYAEMQNADLRRAILDNNATLAFNDLRRSDLSEAALYGADLSFAILRGVNLEGAELSGANLSYADLNNANFRRANLSGANLTGAENVSMAMLDEQTKSLKGATMPNGQKYEDWLKGKEFVADKFEPAFRFELDEGWALLYQTADAVDIQYSAPIGPELIFTSPSQVFDPGNSGEPKEVPAPENVAEWVSWFQRHPNLETSKPVPVSVGGASGVQIDVTLSSTPENYPRDFCGEQPCVPLLPSGLVSLEGWIDRFLIVDVDGETVVVDISAPADKFDEFLPKAQKVLGTVEWDGAQAPSSGEDGENNGPS